MGSPSSPSSSFRSIFRIESGTPDNTAAMEMERSNSTPSSTPAQLPPRSTLDVDEEYDSAFKSKSFLDLWSHAHRHLRHTLSSSFKHQSSSSSKSSSVVNDSRHADDDEEVDAASEAAAGMDEMEQSCSYTVLDDFVLEPSPEVLARERRGGRRRLRRRRHRVEALLIEYFDVTQEACEACSALLAAIGAARRHHLTLRRLLLRLEDSEDGGSGSGSGSESDPAAARDAVAAHVRLDNPLAPGSLPGFHAVHERCAPLAARLASAQRRLARLARAMRVARGAAAAALVAACAAAVVAAAVFAAHAVVGVGAAAAAAAGPGATARWASGERRYARAGAAVDAAARGAYIVGRDLDTVSRMVRRAHDELEHGRDVARIAVLGRGERPAALLREVAREEAECEEDLRAQLEEMEEHVCLCLITINRSRRMVATEMTRGWVTPTPTAAKS